MGGAQLISVTCRPEEVSAKKADIIGFVSPVYEWDIPGVMKSFLEKLEINPSAYIFAVSTYIFIHGCAFETVENILSKKGAHLSYGKGIYCVASQCTAYPHNFKELPKIYLDIESEYDRGFYTSEDCVHCGICAKVCPLGNIKMSDQKPVWHNTTCHGCMACGAYCPKKAILFKAPEAYMNSGLKLAGSIKLDKKR